ncbi:type II secretion system protein [Intestinibacter sp.]|uniref:type II secretion system protein n=1 Tax=Intestinibacter sp. TaxID=1965304 RepID=UPI002A9114B1|nr:type II secretion system protein [Intestinibacter sp.]MDY5213038.1 type II secretion system protein [Intestinibacter sp.]
MKLKAKKKGFTLVELIAVMAIIVILATTIAPKVLGYIDKGKKTNAIEEARQVVLAVDSYNISNTGNEIKTDDKYSDFKDKINSADFIDISDVKYIADTNTYEELNKIVKGTVDFNIEDSKIEITNKIDKEN